MRRKFYKAKLPSVVWNPLTDSALAVFERGQFITEDEEVAEILINKGYPEVELDATSPPPIPDDPIQTGISPNVRVLGDQVTEETALSKAKREAMMKKEKSSEKEQKKDTKKAPEKKKAPTKKAAEKKEFKKRGK